MRAVNAVGVVSVERLKDHAESEEQAVDFAVQECPEYESFMVVGYTPSAVSKPGYYTVLAVEDEDEPLEWEDEYRF